MNSESPRDEAARLLGEQAIAQLAALNERLRDLTDVLDGRAESEPRPQLRVIEGGCG